MIRNRLRRHVSVRRGVPVQNGGTCPCRAPASRCHGCRRPAAHRSGIYRIAKPMRRSSERIGIGAMDQPHMMQRHLAGGEFQHRRLAFVDVHHDLLAAGQQVSGGEGVAMRHLVQLVRAGDHPHRAIRRGAVGERHPGGDDVGWFQSPVGRVLVPRNIARIALLLDEECCPSTGYRDRSGPPPHPGCGGGGSARSAR